MDNAVEMSIHAFLFLHAGRHKVASIFKLKTFLAGQSQQRPPLELATTALDIGLALHVVSCVLFHLSLT